MANAAASSLSVSMSMASPVVRLRHTHLMAKPVRAQRYTFDVLPRAVGVRSVLAVSLGSLAFQLIKAASDMMCGACVAPFRALHDMLVARPVLIHKGRLPELSPAPSGHSSRGKIQAPCPSPLRSAVGVFRPSALAG